MEIKSTSKIDVQITLQLTEVEARALQAITVYGTKEFLKCFYTHLGRNYLEPHEEGVVALFETIKTELPFHINKVNDVRDVWMGKKVAKTFEKSISEEKDTE